MSKYLWVLFIFLIHKLTSQVTDSLIYLHQHQVLFQNNSYVIIESEKKKLSFCIDSLEKLNIKFIHLEGHTNTIGSIESNNLLSENRVNAVIDYFTTNGSITIYKNSFGELKPRYPNKTKSGLENNRQVIVSFGKKIKMQWVQGIIKDSITGISKIKVFYKNNLINDSTYTDVNGKFKFKSLENIPVTVYTNEKNYFNNALSFTPEPNNKNEINLEITPYVTNKEIVLDNILFYSNKNIVRKGIDEVLDKLTNNFIANSEYCFEIQGHVNGTDKLASFEKHYKDLSEARAGAVYFYMIDEGVKPERMIPKGYSNSKMLFPGNPTFAQQLQNMRVVIKLLDCHEVKNRRTSFNEDQLLKLTKSAKYNSIVDSK